MKLLYLLTVVAICACWFHGCDLHLTIGVVREDVRPMPAFRFAPTPRVTPREETL